MKIPKYRIEKKEVTISVGQYLREYVDVDTFLQYCKACPSYNQKWSCPPYDFNVEEYWEKYENLKVASRDIIFEDVKHMDIENPKKIMDEIRSKERDYLTLDLWEMEKTFHNSISLSAGSCVTCGEGKCAKAIGDKCINPKDLRYSIESLGGNVGKTCTDLLDINLEWMEEGKLPKHFTLIGGVLYGYGKNS